MATTTTTDSRPVELEFNNRTLINENHILKARSVSWGSLFAGSFITLATIAALMLLGFGIGMAVIEPGMDPDSPAAFGIGSSIFTVVAQLIGLVAGGYAATRLASVVSKPKAMLYGAVIWAIVTIVSAYFATTATRAVIGGAYSALNSAISSAGSATAALIPDDLQLSDFNMIDDVAVSALPQSVRSRLQAQGLTAEQIKQEAESMFNRVVSDREIAQVQNVLGATAQDMLRTPGDAGADLNQMVDKLIGSNGVFSEADRVQARNVLRTEFGLSSQEAEQIFNRWETTLQSAAAETEQALVAAKQQAIATADAATDGIATAAFLAFLASILGLGAAIAGAMMGRVKPEDLQNEEYVQARI